jgi:hypothetical protein
MVISRMQATEYRARLEEGARVAAEALESAASSNGGPKAAQANGGDASANGAGQAAAERAAASA